MGKSNNIEMPVYYMIDGQEGYKTKEEIIEHLNNKIKQKAELKERIKEQENPNER